MALITELFKKLQTISKPMSYVELAAVMGVSNLRVRNATRDMVTRGVPIKKERRYQEMYINLTTKHTYEHFIDKHKALVKRVEKFIKASPGEHCDDDIAVKFKISAKYSHDIVCYLSRTNGVKVIKKRVDCKDYYSIAGFTYVSKPKGNFDNQCIDHLLFNGCAMEAVKIHKSISQLRG